MYVEFAREKNIGNGKITRIATTKDIFIAVSINIDIVNVTAEYFEI